MIIVSIAATVTFKEAPIFKAIFIYHLLQNWNGIAQLPEKFIGALMAMPPICCEDVDLLTRRSFFWIVKVP
jgi:hypothetical protein